MSETITMVAMLSAIYLVVLASIRFKDFWGRLVSLSSLSTKISVFLIAFGVFEESKSIAMVGVLYLLVSGSSVMLLSYFLGRKEK